MTRSKSIFALWQGVKEHSEHQSNHRKFIKSTCVSKWHSKKGKSLCDKGFATARSRGWPPLGVQGLEHGTSNIVLGYPIGEKGDFFQVQIGSKKVFRLKARILSMIWVWKSNQEKSENYSKTLKFLLFYFVFGVSYLHKNKKRFHH